MSKFALYKIVYQSNKYYFLAPENSYQGIEIETGVTKVTDADEKKMPPCKVEELIKSPVAVRKTISGKLGTKRKYFRLLVAADKVNTFDAAIVGKIYQGILIDGSVIRRRATFY